MVTICDHSFVTVFTQTEEDPLLQSVEKTLFLSSFCLYKKCFKWCFFFFKCYFSLGIANQEQLSLAQRCDLWKKSSQEKHLVCERLEKDKAVLSEKIQVRRIITWLLKWNSIFFIYDCKYIPLNWLWKKSKLVFKPLKILKRWPHMDIIRNLH